MKTRTYIRSAVLFSLAVIGLSTPAWADAILTIDFVSTDLVHGSTANVLQGNLVFDQTTNTITGITNDFDGCCGFPDPNFQFADLNGGKALFNVGDAATVTAIPGTSQVITDSTTGVTFDWTSVTSNVFPGFVNVAFNGTIPPLGGPNTIVVGGVDEGNFLPGDFVNEIASTTTSSPGSVPEPNSLILLISGVAGLMGLLRRGRNAAIA